jgi:hypothetical protein
MKEREEWEKWRSGGGTRERKGKEDRGVFSIDKQFNIIR